MSKQLVTEFAQCSDDSLERGGHIGEVGDPSANEQNFTCGKDGRGAISLIDDGEDRNGDDWAGVDEEQRTYHRDVECPES